MKMYKFSMDYSEAANMGTVSADSVDLSFSFTLDSDGIHIGSLNYDDDVTLEFLSKFLVRANKRLVHLLDTYNYNEGELDEG